MTNRRWQFLTLAVVLLSLYGSEHWKAYEEWFSMLTIVALLALLWRPWERE